jgi:ankyrin repeat protein
MQKLVNKLCGVANKGDDSSVEAASEAGSDNGSAEDVSKAGGDNIPEGSNIPKISVYIKSAFPFVFVENSKLFAAIKDGDINAVKFLCKTKKDANTQDRHGHPPIFYAIKKGDRDTIDHLFELGVDLNQKDNNGRHLIYYAIEKGDRETINHLFELGVDLNQKDNNGCPLIFYAIEKGNAWILEILVKLGADLNQKDNHGCTAFDFADQQKSDIKTFLRMYKEAGSSVESPNAVQVLARSNSSLSGDSK